jgi:hypothetical protein
MDSFQGNPVAYEIGKTDTYVPAILVDTEIKFLTMETIMAPEFTLTDNPQLGYSCGTYDEALDVAERYVNRRLAKEARFDDAMGALAAVLTAPMVPAPMDNAPLTPCAEVDFRFVIDIKVTYNPISGDIIDVGLNGGDDGAEDFAFTHSVNGQDTDSWDWDKSIESLADRLIGHMVDDETVDPDLDPLDVEELMDNVQGASWKAYEAASAFVHKGMES